MSYTSIPTKADGDILTAAHLNLLSANQEFLWGLGNTVNTPFNSFRDTKVTLDNLDALWYGRHRCRYLHYKVTSYGGSWNYARIYFSGLKVAAMESAGTSFSGAFDLTDYSGLPNLVGAWSGSSVSYDDDQNGDGASGNSDDGDVVTHGGNYFRCKLSHTSGGSNEPGVGGSWATYWDGIAPPTLLALCTAYADINFNSGTEVGVEYILEADSPTL